LSGVQIQLLCPNEYLIKMNFILVRSFLKYNSKFEGGGDLVTSK